MEERKPARRIPYAKKQNRYLDYNLLPSSYKSTEYTLEQKAQKRREMIEAIGKQSALYGVTGTTIGGSPADVLGLTASNFAENVYIDAFNTSQKILGKEQQKDILNQESKNAIIGGYTAAATTLGTREFMDIITTQGSTPNTGPNSEISKTSRIRTATEGSS